MFSVCVFCGSTPGANPAFLDAAVRLGNALAEAGIGVVYGGGGSGLMGAVSGSALAGGGQVTGVMPKSLQSREAARTDLTDLHVVESMHERKALMYELSSAFVTLPGGLGTFDEFFETATWTRLGLHTKPSLVLNVDGYYDSLQALLENALANEFFSHGDQKLISFHDDVPTLIEQLVKLGRAAA